MRQRFETEGTGRHWPVGVQRESTGRTLARYVVDDLGAVELGDLAWPARR